MRRRSAQRSTGRGEAVIDRRKFIREWIANGASLAVLAVTGLLLNSLIAKLYGSAALGIFNQVYAVFVFASQIATAGIQFSVLRYLPPAAGDHPQTARILTSALALVAITAAAITLAVYASFRLAGGRVFSAGVTEGVMLMLPGLWCFSVNKTLLNALNGIEANTAYAVLVGLRYLLILLFLSAAIGIGLRGEQLAVILSGSEITLLIVLAAACWRYFPGLGLAPEKAWMTTHWRFGLQSMPGGFAVELNSRADVLILGMLTSDAVVGVYSFAAFFVEGLLQIPVITRRLIDPIVARIAGDGQALRALLTRGRNVAALAAAGLGIAAVAAYPWYATLAGTRELARDSWPVFAILMAGACIFGIYATFGGVFSQTGRPVIQTRLNLAILGVNVVLNFALVPFYGLLGAAVATGLSFIAGTFYFRHLVRRYLSLRF
jgi:O-antigen/teichoic acid export membrane protein